VLPHIKTEQLTAQSPIVFSFNESMYHAAAPQPKIKQETTPTIFDRLPLPSTISQDSLQNAAATIKRIPIATNEALRLLPSGHRALATISQELSLERDKRRSELKQLTALSDAEIDNVEACIESVLQNDSISVKRFQCTAEIEANFIDEEIRENVDMLETNIEELTNFRHFGRGRKRNNAGLIPVCGGTSQGNFGRPSLTSISVTTPDIGSHRAISGASLPMGRAHTPSASQLLSARSPDEQDSRSYLSSIESVILRHSEVVGGGATASRKHSPAQSIDGRSLSLHLSPEVSQHVPTSGKSYSSSSKHMLSMSAAASGEVSNAKEPRLISSMANAAANSADYGTPIRAASSGRNQSPNAAAAVTPGGFQLQSAPAAPPPASTSAFSPKGLLGMPLPFQSANPLLQNMQSIQASALAAVQNPNLLRSPADTFRIDHSASSMLNSPSTSSAPSNNSGAPPGSANTGGGDMHININLMAHYPAYHPDILPALYAANSNQSASTRLFTVQIPSAPGIEGIESQVFVSRITTLFSVFNELQHVWEGIVELKNSQARMKLRFLRGNITLAVEALNKNTLNINQRMTLEEQELEGLTQNLQNDSDHCVMLGLPFGSDSTQIYSSHKVLDQEIAKYLRQKDAAGIINIPHKYVDRDTLSVLHIFPPCEFARKYLMKLDLFIHLDSSPSSYLLFILTSADVAARTAAAASASHPER